MFIPYPLWLLFCSAKSSSLTLNLLCSPSRTWSGVLPASLPRRYITGMYYHAYLVFMLIYQIYCQSVPKEIIIETFKNTQNKTYIKHTKNQGTKYVCMLIVFMYICRCTWHGVRVEVRGHLVALVCLLLWDGVVCHCLIRLATPCFW